MRVPLEGGGQSGCSELTADKAAELGECLKNLIVG